jgi:hypothetical protein
LRMIRFRNNGFTVREKKVHLVLRIIPREASKLLFVRASGLFLFRTSSSLDVSIVVGIDRPVGDAVWIEGMTCVSHGIVTTTFEDPLRNSSIVSVPPNIFKAVRFGALPHGMYLLLFVCLRMSAMNIWISPDRVVFWSTAYDLTHSQEQKCPVVVNLFVRSSYLYG